MRHGGLIRAVGGTGGQTALADCLLAGLEAAEGLVIRSGDAQLGQCREIQLRHRAGQTLRPGQRVLNGDAHIRHAKLRDDGMIGKLHRGMDDALPLDNDLDLILRQAEEPRGLDQLKALVHQGGRIDGNFCTHIPVGVLEGVRLRLGAQLLGAHTEERPAGGGQQDLFQRFGAVLILQALEDGAVLTVHRQQVNTVFLDGIGHQMAAGDKALLVGQRQIMAALDSRQRGIQTRNADNSVQHRACAVHGGQLTQAVRPLQQLGRARLPRQRGGQPVERGRVGDSHILRVKFSDLGQQLVYAGVG